MNEEYNLSQSYQDADNLNLLGKMYLNFVLDSDVLEWIHEQAKVTGSSTDNLINAALREYVTFHREIRENVESKDRVYDYLTYCEKHRKKDLLDVLFEKREINFNSIQRIIREAVSVSRHQKTRDDKLRDSKLKDERNIGILRNTASPETLRNVELEIIQHELKPIQYKEKLDDVFMYFLSLFIVVTFLTAFEIDVTELNTNLIYGMFNTPTAMIGLVLLVIKIFTHLIFRYQHRKIDKRIYLVQRAQVKQPSKAQGNHDHINSQPMIKKKPSLMSQLKNIRIDGPEDFAANIDLYLNGEKRVK